jgi:hypothetical protein
MEMEERAMMKLKLAGAAAILATAAFVTPAVSQEATQEPGMIGFNYPNSNYLLGGYGVRTPSRYDYSYYGPQYGPRYYGPGPVGLAAGVAAGALGTAAAIAGAPYVDSYAYYEGPAY